MSGEWCEVDVDAAICSNLSVLHDGSSSCCRQQQPTRAARVRRRRPPSSQPPEDCIRPANHPVPAITRGRRATMHGRSMSAWPAAQKEGGHQQRATLSPPLRRLLARWEDCSSAAFRPSAPLAIGYNTSTLRSYAAIQSQRAARAVTRTLMRLISRRSALERGFGFARYRCSLI